MEVTHHFAILAPIPLEHLEAGKEIDAAEGSVAFGTRKWELFRRIDELRGGLPIPVLIYPSHEDVPGNKGCIVSWFGWYVHSVDGVSGAHPDGMKFRPKSTAAYENDNKGHWTTFWHVKGLRELPPGKQISIGKIGTIKGGWRKESPPHGPELVALPETLSYET